MKDQYAFELIEQLKRVGDTLSRIERSLRPGKPAKSIEILTLINGQWVEGKNMILKAGEKAVLKLRILDASGNPARVEKDQVDWSSSDPAMGELKVDKDMMTAEFIPSGMVGKTMIQAKGDADLGEGVKELMGEIEIETLSGEAVIFELSGEAAPL